CGCRFRYASRAGHRPSPFRPDSGRRQGWQGQGTGRGRQWVYSWREPSHGGGNWKSQSGEGAVWGNAPLAHHPPLCHCWRMAVSNSSYDLVGKLLIAMPGMGDPRFGRSLIYICEHEDDTTMGLIVNKPLPNLDFATLLRQLDIEQGADARAMPVHFGGPVETGRGFVLHMDDYQAAEGTVSVGGGFAMSATRDVLEDLALG